MRAGSTCLTADDGIEEAAITAPDAARAEEGMARMVPQAPSAADEALARDRRAGSMERRTGSEIPARVPVTGPRPAGT